jgi:hypothetical protein
MLQSGSKLPRVGATRKKKSSLNLNQIKYITFPINIFFTLNFEKFLLHLTMGVIHLFRSRDKITDCRRNTTTRLRIEKLAAAIKHLKKRDTDQNKWRTPLVRCTKNFSKFKENLIENFNRFYLI